ncbi:MAG: type II toxin-antitoxin system RelE/ParE family toxin [Akkermansiaceae bacterium]|nr:type II toxin-antitoxin system RelE/ParE family toxin [Akkermansiaceae bacterium]NNM29766.1 type II toxin-antitoxin system RelE/ParE family toxin [Akkermansiaceae bacterium]
MEVWYLEEAFREGFGSAEWYEEQDPGLGERFCAEWKRAENGMVSNPELPRFIHADVRRWRFQIFPYQLLYRVVPGGIQVLAVMHLARNPGYWKDRMK